MRFQPFRPRPPLDRWVELIWVLQGVPSYRREKVLPNGVVELIVNLGSPHLVVDPDDFRRAETYREAWVAGMQERFLVIQAMRESNLVGIRFRPGGAFPLLRASLAELTNRVVECDRIWGRAVDALRERLAAAATPAAKARVAEAWLRERLDPDPPIERWFSYALAALRRPAAPRRIGELARVLGVSERRLRRRFRTVVGLNPKLLARVHRFQSVIAAVNRAPRVDWAAVALDCGYFDQAHLIRDFRAFSAVTPTEYLRARDADENHIIVD